jgi:hypothetical protein
MGRLERMLQRHTLQLVQGVSFVVEHEVEHRPLGESGLFIEDEAASGDGCTNGHAWNVSQPPPRRSFASAMLTATVDPPSPRASADCSR